MRYRAKYVWRYRWDWNLGIWELQARMFDLFGLRGELRPPFVLYPEQPKQQLERTA